MQNNFDILINSYIQNHIGIDNYFLSASLSMALKKQVLGLFEDNKFHAAGMGNKNRQIHNELMRSDQIYWLDRSHENISENLFLDLIDDFVKHLNETCYTGITGYEFHYTIYEKGSFYKKHIDQFQNDHSRVFSMITYLNEDWEAKDGGDLRIYHPDSIQDISPNAQKSVFFKSNELAHEVLITHEPRLSITGWLKVG